MTDQLHMSSYSVSITEISDDTIRFSLNGVSEDDGSRLAVAEDLERIAEHLRGLVAGLQPEQSAVH